MKICTKCEVDYPEPLEDHFNKRAGSKDGLQHRCKKCISEAHKEHYSQHKSYYKTKAKKHTREYRKRNLQVILDYLEKHPCVDCGETDPIVLEFDHIKNKSLNISIMWSRNTSPVKDILDEISKCEVRCANCHRRKTAKQLGWYKILENET
jgi:hypothetical protein